MSGANALNGPALRDALSNETVVYILNNFLITKSCPDFMFADRGKTLYIIVGIICVLSVIGCVLRVSRNRRQKYVQEKNMSLCEPRARNLNTCGYGHVSWSAAQLQHAPPEPGPKLSGLILHTPMKP